MRFLSYTHRFSGSLLLFQSETVEDYLRKINADSDTRQLIKDLSIVLDQPRGDDTFFEVSTATLNYYQRKFKDLGVSHENYYEKWYLLQLDRLLDHLNLRYMNDDPRVLSILLKRMRNDPKILKNNRSLILLLKLIIPERAKSILRGGQGFRHRI